MTLDDLEAAVAAVPRRAPEPARERPIGDTLDGILARASALVPCRDCGVPKPRVVVCTACGPGRERQERLDAARRHVATIRAGLPGWSYARLEDAGWRARIDQRALRAAQTWTPGKALVLLGPSGAGKSSSLVARLRRLCEAHLEAVGRDERSTLPAVMWATEQQLVDWSRQHRLGTGEDPDLARAAHVGVLVIDELRGVGLELVPSLVDRRYAHPSGQRWTVLTAGFSRQELGQRYGGHMIRRLAEGGEVVDLHGGGR